MQHRTTPRVSLARRDRIAFGALYDRVFGAIYLERVTLAPGVMLEGPPPGALRVLTPGPTIAYLPKATDGSVTNLPHDPIEAYVLTLVPAGTDSGATGATPAP